VRTLLPLATRLSVRLLPLLALLAGCLGELPAAPAVEPAPPATASGKADGVELRPLEHASFAPDAPELPDAGASPSPDLARPRADLMGLVDCFGSAVCDPTAMICIKYLNGTTGNPGGLRTSPSCYAPNDPCAGGNYDCACIQADPALAMFCGTCIDNRDRTFTCYATAP